MPSLRALAVLLLAAIPSQAQDPVSAEPARFFVRAAAELEAGRRARLDAVRAAVLGAFGDAEFRARLAALTVAGGPAQDAVRRAVEDAGGRVIRRFDLLGGALAELPAGAPAALAAHPAIAEVTAERTHAAHIGVATAANNHGADLVQGPGSAHRGRGATLALLDCGIDLSCGSTGGAHPAFLDPDRGDATRIAAAFGAAATDDREDRLGHGTAVAGIAVARDWDPGPAGDDGFAPEAAVASFKITARSLATYADGDLLTALDSVARERIRLGLSVANLSWAGVPSPTYVIERALDELAHFFDVVVVVSAGNDGDLPNPTARSHGCTNALAVAALHPDTHVVWERSTYGPLLGQPERTWPDLAAVGVGVRTPWPDQPGGAGPPQTGTSFAAPMVAGTALVLRAAEPSLTGLETRALLLGTTQDVSAANPGLGPHNFGVGMLRTDLAVDALRTGARYRGRVTSAAPDTAIDVEPAPGTTVIATLVWDRADAFRADWDDLDLEIAAPDGRVVAVSESPRDLYERAVFVADRPGAYRAVVRGRSLVAPAVDWALLVTASRGGARQAGSYRGFGAPCPGLGLDPAQGVQTPAFAAGRFGTAKLELPLAGPPGRLLQILDGASLPPDLTVRALGLRRDESSSGAPGWRVNLSVSMGHTARSPAAPSPVFAANFTAPVDLAPVLDARALDLPGVVGQPPSAVAWDFVLPLDRPFVASSPIAPNVVVDFQLRGHSRGSGSFGLFLDAELDVRTASVVARGDPYASSGTADPVGLILALLDGTAAPVAPRLDPDRTPQLGETMRVVLRGARPDAIAALVHGHTADAWGPHALPFALDALGAPGCALLVSPDVLLPAPIGASGQASVPVAIPSDRLWTGAVFYQQFLVLDPSANALGVAASPGGVGRVGM